MYKNKSEGLVFAKLQLCKPQMLYIHKTMLKAYYID